MQESMALINDCVMALGDDNDFGLEGNTESGVVIVQLGTCINQLVMQPCQVTTSSASPRFLISVGAGQRSLKRTGRCPYKQQATNAVLDETI
eukprot:1590795-Pyramimonas_sp.AAC.2